MSRKTGEVIIDLHVPEKTAQDLEGLALAAGLVQTPHEGQGEKADLTPLTEKSLRLYAWVVREQAEGRIVVSLAPETHARLQANHSKIPGFFANSLPNLVPQEFHQRLRSFFRR